MAADQDSPAIRVSGLVNRFGNRPPLHDGLDFTVGRGEIIGIVGGSGSGKSVLLRTIVGLNRQASGTIEVLGEDTGKLNAQQTSALRRRWGLLFQEGALFSSLTVLENISFPLREHTAIGQNLRREIASLKLRLVGLPDDAGSKTPSELSGGMKKRAGLARALSLDPELLFLDEPTAGLDPISAEQFDSLILELRDALGLTVVMITHDLDSLYAICDRVAVLIDKKIRVGTIAELEKDPHPWIHDYFGGPRGRAAASADARNEASPPAGETAGHRKA